MGQEFGSTNERTRVNGKEDEELAEAIKKLLWQNIIGSQLLRWFPSNE
jgi:hypothetical protein